MNENIGLTAVHAIFHAEHNRLVEQTKDDGLASRRSRLPERMAAGTARRRSRPRRPRSPPWSGMANACSRPRSSAPRCSTSISSSRSSRAPSSRNVDLFFAPTQVYDVDLDPSIVAEFAHTVYRFGHSMLTETVDRFDAELQHRRRPATRSADRPDRGLPQSARLRRQRPDPGGGDQRHHPRRHPPGRQRDRRIRHRSAAQQPPRLAARPSGDQPRAWPRHRHSVSE